MTPYMRLIVVFAVSMGLTGATMAQATKPASCEVRLASEIERSDAQVYLMRLELSVTKRQLAQALAKCGEACAASK